MACGSASAAALVDRALTCPCVVVAAPQCALAYKKLGIAPIVMSAGELESGNAGEPAKLIRQRYREVSMGRKCPRGARVRRAAGAST